MLKTNNFIISGFTYYRIGSYEDRLSKSNDGILQEQTAKNLMLNHILAKIEVIETNLKYTSYISYLVPSAKPLQIIGTVACRIIIAKLFLSIYNIYFHYCCLIIKIIYTST